MSRTQNTWDQVHEAVERAAEVIDGHFDEFDYDKLVKLQEELDLPKGILLHLDGGYDTENGEYVEPVVIASGWMDHYVDGEFKNVIQSGIYVS